MKSKLLQGHPCGFNIMNLVSHGSNITCLHLKYVEIHMAEVTLLDMNLNTHFYWGADKSLARPGSKKATATKL